MNKTEHDKTILGLLNTRAKNTENRGEITDLCIAELAEMVSALDMAVCELAEMISAIVEGGSENG